MKLEEACIKLAKEFGVEEERVMVNVNGALGKTGWQRQGGYEFDDWEVACPGFIPDCHCGGRRKILARFTHEMNGVPLAPDILTVVLTTARSVVVTCVQRNCKELKKLPQWVSDR